METYQLKSKLVESDREFLIKTRNDISAAAISSEVWINGVLVETDTHPQLEDYDADDVVSLLKSVHEKKKNEIEYLMEAFRHALEDGSSDSLTQLGIAFYYKQYFLEARELFQNATVRNAQSHLAFNYLGLTELALGQPEEAAKMLYEAAKQQPGFADYRNNLGLALHAHGASDQAVGEFEQALGLNLYYADAYFNLGMVLLAQAPQQSDASSRAATVSKAMECFKKAVLIYPDYDSSLFEEATRAIANSDLDKAFELFSRIRRQKQEKHRREFAGFHMKQTLDPQMISEERLRDQIRYLEGKIEGNPMYVDLYSDLSRCYLEYSRVLWEKGVMSYRKTTELNPSLGIAATCYEEAKKELSAMNAALDRIVKKG
ncbi:MAG: hypothetical protein KOO62_01860 [candidate division Zixibacteria bacterium]|nr:hypothetical protein [candidate division Zixibacteria bacterium]